MVVFSTAPPVWAWGPLGHRVIARLAERNLNPKAKKAVVALLEEAETMADASTWADEHLSDLPKTGPWHYVDVPLDELKYNVRFSGEMPEKGCIVEKIKELKKTLKDRTKSIEERRFALRFLIHLIEDLHMPLHVGDNHDKGGNKTQVRFFDEGTNMHRLWDSGMILHAGDTEDFWLADLAELDTPNHRIEARKGTVEDWATESLMLAKAAYSRAGNRQEVEARTEAGRCLYEHALARCAKAALPGGHAAGAGAQRGISGAVSAACRGRSRAGRAEATKEVRRGRPRPMTSLICRADG